MVTQSSLIDDDYVEKLASIVEILNLGRFRLSPKQSRSQCLFRSSIGFAPSPLSISVLNAEQIKFAKNNFHLMTFSSECQRLTYQRPASRDIVGILLTFLTYHYRYQFTAPRIGRCLIRCCVFDDIHRVYSLSSYDVSVTGLIIPRRGHPLAIFLYNFTSSFSDKNTSGLRVNRRMGVFV